jgi:hypothetical protein
MRRNAERSFFCVINQRGRARATSVQTEPEVGLDDVARQQRAIHVEDRNRVRAVHNAAAGRRPRAAHRGEGGERRHDSRNVDVDEVVAPVDDCGVEAPGLDVARIEIDVQRQRAAVGEVQLGVGVRAVEIEVTAQKVEPATLAVQ